MVHSCQTVVTAFLYVCVLLWWWYVCSPQGHCRGQAHRLRISRFPGASSPGACLSRCCTHLPLCVYACVRMHAHVCIHVCVCLCMSGVRVHTHTRMHTGIHVCYALVVSACVCAHVCMCTCGCMHEQCVCVCVHSPEEYLAIANKGRTERLGVQGALLRICNLRWEQDEAICV